MIWKDRKDIGSAYGFDKHLKIYQNKNYLLLKRIIHKMNYGNWVYRKLPYTF